MTETSLRYDKMVENALRSVVRDALVVAANQGLPGAHHFYITFRTGFPGVVVPDFLRAQYPDEMTIVLEHQFWGLEVDDIGFAVTLSFKSQPQRLVVPFAAITAFADPSVSFGLEFRSDQSGSGAPTAQSLEAEAKPDPSTGAADKAADVVKLDAFRKK
jgi:hypothetical protein